MGKHLVFVGGGHAHLGPLSRLEEFVERGHRVTVISLEDHHYYSGMGPGVLGGFYEPYEARFPLEDLVKSRGASFIAGRVSRVDPEARVLTLESGATVSYDVVSFNTGSEVPLPPPAKSRPNVYPVKPISNLIQAREGIRSRLAEGENVRVLVIGGGAAGVEVTANCLKLSEEAPGDVQLRLIAGSRLLAGYPHRARRLALESLKSRGAEVREDTWVKELTDEHAVTSDDWRCDCDVALVATGVRPSEMFRRSGLPTTADGALRVNEKLQCEQCAEIFGGGDCVGVEGYNLARVGVHAVMQGPVLFDNLMASMEGGELRPYDPRRNYMLILNMGDGSGIGWKWGWTLDGRLTFKLKDYIDRRFVRRYQ